MLSSTLCSEVSENSFKIAPLQVTIRAGWWFQPLWKNISQLGWLFPIDGTIKHVPNHQPESVCCCLFSIYFVVYMLIHIQSDPHLLTLFCNRVYPHLVRKRPNVRFVVFRFLQKRKRKPTSNYPIARGYRSLFMVCLWGSSRFHKVWSTHDLKLQNIHWCIIQFWYDMASFDMTHDMGIEAIGS